MAINLGKIGGGGGGGLGGALGKAGDWFNKEIVQQKKKPAIYSPAVSPQTGAPAINIPTEIGPPGGKTPAIPQVADPYLEQAKAAAAGISGMLPKYQQLYGTTADALTGLIGDLQKQARGEAGPGRSLAEALLQQGLTQNVGAVQSQLASQRGLSAAQRGRLASRQIAALQGQTAQQAGLMGLQQQLAAQQQLGQLGLGAAGLGSESQLKGAGLLTGQSTEQARIAAGIAQANQAAQAADKARTVGAVTSALGAGAQLGAASIMSPSSQALTTQTTQPTGIYSATPGQARQYEAYAAHGGRIDGVAPYAGDTPKNDVVRANLSPGEIVIPRSAAGSKKAAKAFIEALDDWDEEPSYGKVLKARQKKNYADGGKVDFPLGGPYAPVSPEKMSAAYDQEIPAAQKMKQSFEKFLTERVVDPLAQRGYPTLGAALATVPSVAADVMIPSTTGELQAGVIPFPGAKLSKAAKEALAKEGKVERALVDKVIEPKLIESKKLLSDRERSKLYGKKEKEVFGVIDATGTKENWMQDVKPVKELNEETLDVSNWMESAVKDASEPYSGNIHNNLWRSDFKPGVQQKPQLVGDLKGVLGKDVPKGGSDPFVWMDTKYGATKKALEQNFDKPLTINTRSDLIAHDDYINLLNPEKHKINIHILSPEDDRITRILEPGAPNTKRRLQAAQKLQDLGFNVTLVQDILKSPKLSETLRNKVSSFSDLGDFNQKVNNVFLDDAAVERLKKVLGDLVK